ncbi:MAG: DUF72 domain-containing protein [Deltaproteobacteria bacterium]|nr:DUF72 domain-containing protein [Deltaproteobacteria bacterium]
MICIGTSGFDYADWRGFFYPKKLLRKTWLSYYSKRFHALELNFSYYRMPNQGQLASMVDRTDGKVEFAVKAHRSMTHERTASDIEYSAFIDAIGELRDAERLGAVLAQFPYSFRQSEENRVYLKRLADRLGPPLVVELRRSDWATDPIRDWLEQLGVGYCCVDEPRIKGLMPPEAVATANPAYVRFHGRNADKWYKHDRPEERYDYRYQPSELKEWSLKIRNLENKANKVLVFFNNHFQAKAVEAAEIMERLLAQSDS